MTRTVYRLVWHGDPAVGGGYHTASVGTEFDSEEEAMNAARKTGIHKRPGFRVENREVTEWRTK